MSRHKHKNPRAKVYFQYKGRCFRLLEAINFGSKSSPELKIKGLAETYLQTKDDQHRFDGKFHVGQLIRLIDGNHVEFTYHRMVRFYLRCLILLGKSISMRMVKAKGGHQ